MKTVIYGIPNCDTMKKARSWLTSHGVAHEFHDYKVAGIERAKLEGWIASVGWEVLLNRAGTTFRKLPDNFRALCTDLVIRIDDFATDEVLDHLGARSEFDVLGLFQGVGLPFRSESAPVQMPNMIWLYRRPILDYWSEHDESLGEIVTHVLVHEIGHHFGMSDSDMEAIERAAD